MIGMVVIGHGPLPDGLVGGAKMLAGDNPHLRSVALAGDEGPEMLRAKLEEAAAGYESVLVLADVFGGTPSRVAMEWAYQQQEAEVVTGVNLPMLLELSLAQVESLAELKTLAVETGTAGIVDALARLRENTGGG